MTQHVKRAAVVTGLAALVSMGLGTATAHAEDSPSFLVAIPVTTQVPQPAYDPCPAGYKGAIVGVDYQNGTGYRVYGCYKI